MPISPARLIAFDVLKSVETHHAYASDLLRAKLGDTSDATEATDATPGPADLASPLSVKEEPALPRQQSASHPPVNSKDAALATELTFGVLRHRMLLDFLTETLARRKATSLDLEVLVALRLGLYQLRFLDRIPASAAVNESVELVKRAKKSSAAPLVNAVLRRAANKAETFARASIDTLLPATLSPAQRLAILHSHPAWLIEKWIAQVGAEATTALLEFNNRTPEISGLFHFPAERVDDERALTEDGVAIAPGNLLRDAFRVTHGVASRTHAFREGRISIRDEASQAITHLLDVHPGDSVLDLCAAPGGKTAALAFATGPTGSVLAADVSAPRLRDMGRQFRRLRLDHIEVAQLDATARLPFSRRFARILLDVPCSGTGTLARNPEIRYRLSPSDLPRLQAQQIGMLESALSALAPGGRLVYATCSLEAEENDQVITHLTTRHPNLRRVSRDELQQTLAPHLLDPSSASSLIDASGALRTFPPTHSTDAFFAVALKNPD